MDVAVITVVPPVELPVSTTLVLPAALVVLELFDRVPAAELLVAKLTVTPDVALLLPLLSCNCTSRVPFKLTPILAGVALVKLRIDACPATVVRLTDWLKLPVDVVAVTVLTPTVVFVVSVTTATPVLFVVAITLEPLAVPLLSVPPVVVLNVTAWLGIRLFVESFIVALKLAFEPAAILPVVVRLRNEVVLEGVPVVTLMETLLRKI